MIRLTESAYEGGRPIDSYGPGFFRVGGEVIHGPVLVTAMSVSRWGGLDDLAPLVALDGQVDVVLLGTGRTIAFPPPALREALEALNIGVDPMDSAAAARTFNVLLSEGRRIAAALLPVD